MKNRKSEILKLLNYLQTLPAFLLIPFILYGGLGSSPDRPKDNFGIIEIVGFYFVIAFISLFISSFCAYRAGVFLNHGVSIIDLLKKSIFSKDKHNTYKNILVAVTVINWIVTFLFSNVVTLVFFALVSIFSFLVFEINNAIISDLKRITVYSVAQPLWLLAFPFVEFIGVNVLILDFNDSDILLLVNFAICGIILMVSTWSTTSYIVDTENKVISYENPKPFSDDFLYIYFSNIECVQERKFYYIIKSNLPPCKVRKHETNLKIFLQDLQDNGIEIVK